MTVWPGGVSMPVGEAPRRLDITVMESFTTDGGTISGGVDVIADITLTIPEGKTLTVNGGIDAAGHTLTVAGKGTLQVTGESGTTGTNGSGGTGGSSGYSGYDSGAGEDGTAGGNGMTGNLIVDGATVTVYGGKAYAGVLHGTWAE